MQRDIPPHNCLPQVTVGKQEGGESRGELVVPSGPVLMLASTSRGKEPENSVNTFPSQ